MASVTGSILEFVPASGSVNVVLVSGPGSAPAPVAGVTNVEVFTSTSGAADPGYQVAAFIQGAQMAPGTTNEVQAGTLTSTEQIISGPIEVIDTTGHETLSALATGATLIGAAFDTLIGGSGTQILDGLNTNESIVGGTGAYTVYGGQSDTIAGNSAASSSTNAFIVGGVGATIVLPAAGSVTAVPGVNTTITAAAGGANATIFGASGDVINLTGNTGSSDQILGTSGNETITAGSGATTIFGGTGDSITAGAAGTTYVDGTLGGMRINIGAAGSDTFYGALGSGAAHDTIGGTGAANVTVGGLGVGDVVNLAGGTGSAVVNALAGGDSVTLGAGAGSVFGGANDTINLGTGAQLVIGGATNNINVGGSGGSDTIFGSGTDTIGGGAANATVFAGKGDHVNFGSQSGSAVVNALAQNASVTLGSGAASVWGAAGDTVNFGTGSQLATGQSGPMTFTLGSAGTDDVFGSTVAGSGDTINGGSGSLLYNIGIGGDSINLGGSAANATINAFNGTLGDLSLTNNDTISVGTGTSFVFGGGGDRIGVGNSTSAGGTAQFWHSTTVPGASVQFGSNDSVAGSSTANVLVAQYNPATDKIFYGGRATNNQDAAVIASTTNPTAGTTQITLPDGTKMTFIGTFTFTAANFAN